MLYIEPVTRKEIEECSAMEEQLLGEDPMQHAKLEEVQRRKHEETMLRSENRGSIFTKVYDTVA